MEAVEEGTWLTGPNPASSVSVLRNAESTKDEPVSSADIASGVRGHATTINDDSKNHKADTSNDLDRAKSEFNLSNQFAPLFLIFMLDHSPQHNLSRRRFG